MQQPPASSSSHVHELDGRRSVRLLRMLERDGVRMGRDSAISGFRSGSTALDDRRRTPLDALDVGDQVVDADGQDVIERDVGDLARRLDAAGQQLGP